MLETADLGTRKMNTSAASFRDPYTARPWLNSYPTGVPADIAETEYSTLVDIFNKSIVDFAELPAFESRRYTVIR